MSDFVRTAILGTGQLDDPSHDLTGSAADELVARLGACERERAFLLRAGVHATLRRAARLPLQGIAPPAPAAPDTSRCASPKLAALLVSLLDGGEMAILGEALDRLAAAGMRLSPELLPRALGCVPALRGLIRPLLGERGCWLARQRPEWAWALETSSGERELPADLEQRWAEGSAAERKALLALARRLAPDRGRTLVAEGWKHEKAEQRLAWLELLSEGLSRADEPLLAGMLSDRSASVRVTAARLLWRLPESALATRLRGRADRLLELETPRGVLAKLQSAVGSRPARVLRVELPPETYDATWEKEGIVETPPHGAGRRQFWLAQLLASVSPAHWSARFGVPPAELLAAAEAHELSSVLLDALTSAALRHGTSDWYAPLWDAWARTSEPPVLNKEPERELLLRLSPAEAEPRLLGLLSSRHKISLLATFPGPWPASVARAVLARLPATPSSEAPSPGEPIGSIGPVGSVGIVPVWTELWAHAALALPLELLPEQLAVPPLAEGSDYAAHAYVRARERFQAIVSLRLALAREITS